MSDYIETKKIKCPKCKVTPFVGYAVEVTEWTMTYDFSDGMRNKDGNGGTVGSITGVELVCYCNHSWKPRGVAQVTDLDK